jgi:hypothetical protein
VPPTCRPQVPPTVPISRSPSLSGDLGSADLVVTSMGDRDRSFRADAKYPHGSAPCNMLSLAELRLIVNVSVWADYHAVVVSSLLSDACTLGSKLSRPSPRLVSVVVFGNAIGRPCHSNLRKHNVGGEGKEYSFCYIFPCVLLETYECFSLHLTADLTALNLGRVIVSIS